MKIRTQLLFAGFIALAHIGAAQSQSNLWLGIQSQSSNVIVTIHAPVDFTNQVEIYQSTNLFSASWTVAASPFAPTYSHPVTWSASSASVGFFAAGNMNIDTDGDGLPNAREAYVYQTSPTRQDTDGDFFNDGLEIQRLTDPLDAESANRTLYVGTFGNNTYDGYASAVTRGHGPKRNIANGLQAALNGDSVLILNTGNYTETNWAVSGQTTLLLNSPITID